MKRIIKYRSWFLTIGWILTVIFSPRLLDNPWALYAGETLLAIGLNMIFLSDKKKMEKSVSTTPLPLYSSLDYGYVRLIS